MSRCSSRFCVHGSAGLGHETSCNWNMTNVVTGNYFEYLPTTCCNINLCFFGDFLPVLVVVFGLLVGDVDFVFEKFSFLFFFPLKKSLVFVIVELLYVIDIEVVFIFIVVSSHLSPFVFLFFLFFCFFCFFFNINTVLASLFFLKNINTGACTHYDRNSFFGLVV